MLNTINSFIYCKKYVLQFGINIQIKRNASCFENINLSHIQLSKLVHLNFAFYICVINMSCWSTSCQGRHHHFQCVEHRNWNQFLVFLNRSIITKFLHIYQCSMSCNLYTCFKDATFEMLTQNIAYRRCFFRVSSFTEHFQTFSTN